MRKTSTRMLALALSAVMAIGSFTGFGGEVKAYAAEDAQAVVAADVAICMYVCEQHLSGNGNSEDYVQGQVQGNK